MLSTYKQQNKGALGSNSDYISKRYTNIFKKTRRTCNICSRGTAMTKGSKVEAKS